LRDEALDQFGLKTELPVGRHFEIDGGDAEVFLGVGRRLFPRLEIGMRATRNEGDLIVGSQRRACQQRRREKRGAPNETTNETHPVPP